MRKTTLLQLGFGDEQDLWMAVIECHRLTVWLVTVQRNERWDRSSAAKHKAEIIRVTVNDVKLCGLTIDVREHGQVRSDRLRAARLTVKGTKPSRR
jgi:hypothetical protein